MIRRVESAVMHGSKPHWSNPRGRAYRQAGLRYWLRQRARTALQLAPEPRCLCCVERRTA